MRFELLKRCKTNDHFEHKTAQLKRRYEQRTRTGESLSKKLAKDCFILFRNFQGDTNDDIFEVINISRRHDTISQSQGEQCSSEVFCETTGITFRESIARLERDPLTLRGELIQDIDCTVNKTKEQAKQLTTLKSEMSEVTKQLALQNEKVTSLQKENKRMENKISSLQNDSEKQSQENKTVLKQTLAEFKKVHDQNKMLRSEVESQNKETNRLTPAVADLTQAMEPLQNTTSLINKMKTAQELLKTNVDYIYKKQVDNGCLNVSRLDDEKSLGVSSLKSKVCLINSKTKEIEESVESMTSLIKSVTVSTTDIRKRLSNVEKNVKNNMKKKTYSEVISSITSPPQHSEDNSVHNDNQPVCEHVLTESDKHNISTDKNVIPEKISDTVTNHIDSSNQENRGVGVIRSMQCYIIHTTSFQWGNKTKNSSLLHQRHKQVVY